MMSRIKQQNFLIAFVCLVLTTGDVLSLSLSPSDSVSISYGVDLSVDCTKDLGDGVQNVNWFGPIDYWPVGDQSNRKIILSAAEMPRVNGQDARITTTKVVSGDTVILNIATFEPGDVGTYVCRGEGGGQTLERTIAVNGFEAVSISGQADQFVVFGQQSNMNFDVLGKPTPQFTFFKDDKQISVDGSKYAWNPVGGQDKYTLTVFNVQRSDAGRYKISGRQQAQVRTDNFFVTVSVYELPKYEQMPADTEGVVGGLTVLHCRASGVPAPQYRWFTGTQTAASETEITNSFGEGRFRPDPVSGELTVERIQLRDENYYWCQPSNPAGSLDKMPAKFTVLRSPFFSFLNNDTTAKEGVGNTATISCQSEAKPAPTMKFINHETKITYEPGTTVDPRVTVTFGDSQRPEDQPQGQVSLSRKTLTLQIQSPTHNDTGNYTCVSSNKVDTNTTDAAIRINHSPILLTPETQSVYNWGGNSRNLTCRVKAYPHPSWTWSYAGGGEIRQDLTGDVKYRIYYVSYYVYSEAYLEIGIPAEWKDGADGSNKKVFGTYRCSASVSGLGDTIGVVNMKEAPVPGPPRINHVWTTSTEVYFNVSLPGVNGPAVTSLQYTLIGGSGATGGRSEKILLNEIGEVVVKDLLPNVNYLLKVQARNPVGVGTEVTASAQTKAATVPGQAKIVSLNESLYSDSYLLQWEEPSNGGLPIIQYSYSYAEASADRNIKTSTRVDSPNIAKTARTVTILGLKPNTWYAVWLRAQNTAGTASVDPFFFHTRPGGFTQAPKTVAEGQKRPTLDLGALGEVPVEYLIIAAVGLFLFLLIVIDLICCCTRKTGIFMCLWKATHREKKGSDMAITGDLGDSKETGLGLDNIILTETSLPYKSNYETAEKQPLNGDGDSRTANVTAEPETTGKPIIHKGYTGGGDNNDKSSDSLNSGSVAASNHSNHSYQPRMQPGGGRQQAPAQQYNQQYNGRPSGTPQPRVFPPSSFRPQEPMMDSNSRRSNGRGRGQNGSRTPTVEAMELNIRDGSSNSSNDLNRGSPTLPPPPHHFDNTSIGRDYPELSYYPSAQPANRGYPSSSRYPQRAAQAQEPPEMSSFSRASREQLHSSRPSNL